MKLSRMSGPPQGKLMDGLASRGYFALGTRDWQDSLRRSEYPAASARIWRRRRRA